MASDISQLLRSEFTAQTDMIIDTKRVTWTQSEMQAENRNVDDASVESEIETTKSEKVAIAVARRLHLTEDPEFVGVGESLKYRILSLFKLVSGPEPRAVERGSTASRPWHAERQFAGYPVRAQLHRADRVHLARPSKGRARSPMLSPKPTSRINFRRSSRRLAAPASGWSSE